MRSASVVAVAFAYTLLGLVVWLVITNLEYFATTY